MTLISINEAAAQGIERLRQPVWADPLSHLKVDVIDGKTGPWVHLFDPYNLEVNGRDPVNVLYTQIDFDAQAWEVYTGPDSTSEAYKAAQKAYQGV